MSTARRLVLSHGPSAVAMAAPWPALLADQLVVAVVAATPTVAIGTPACPALAAAPDVAPGGSNRATRWLVTAEVGGSWPVRPWPAW
jgi:hypothetical protein